MDDFPVCKKCNIAKQYVQDWEKKAWCPHAEDVRWVLFEEKKEEVKE